MAEEANETARRAFGEGPAAPPPSMPPVAPPAAPPAPTVRSAGALAEWSTRAAAFVLDGLFVFGVACVLTLLIMWATGSTEERDIEKIVYAVCLPLGLYAPLLMARGGKANGQTFGKQMMDLRVVRTNGEPVTFWNAFLRQVIGQQLLITVTLNIYAFADYLWPLRDPRNQALHDKIAKTLVVRTAPSFTLSQPPPSPRRVDETPVGDWLPPRAG